MAASSPPGLLAAMERARAVAVGRVAERVRIDRSAYAAELAVEQVLTGPLERGTRVRIAWEELAARRPPRFAPGERILVVLEQLPAGSLWRRRFPSADPVLIVAAGGDAYLRDPHPSDVALLDAYLRLEAPSDATRAGVMAGMVMAGTPFLADAAVDRLAAIPALDRALDAATAERLLAAAGDADVPLALRCDIVALAGTRRLALLLPGLEALARPGSPCEAPALISIAEIGGGLAPDRVEALLARREDAVRAAGARAARGAVAERRLPALLRTDPSPVVRAAAAIALAATRTAWGVDAAVTALGDADADVRTAAVRALARLGDRAVPALERAALDRPAEAPGAVAALSLAGPAGQQALRRIAAAHRNEHVRGLASLALGHGPHAH